MNAVQNQFSRPRGASKKQLPNSSFLRRTGARQNGAGWLAAEGGMTFFLRNLGVSVSICDFLSFFAEFNYRRGSSKTLEEQRQCGSNH